MTRLSAYQKQLLTSRIKKTVAAVSASLNATSELNLLCEEIWGFSPSDRDVDELLDSVYGYCGEPHQITADEFIVAMNKAE